MPVYINDRFLNNEEAMLHVSDLSMQRGYAIFDFFRTSGSVPLFIEEHLDRFYHSAAAMRLPVKQSSEELKSIVLQLISESAIPEAGIRIMLTGGYSPTNYEPATPNLLITCNPIKMFGADEFEKGFALITHKYQRALPHIKTINYLMGVWLIPELQKHGADDVLYVNNNLVTELPRSNIFMVDDNDVLATPSYNILSGITRQNILKLAKDIMQVTVRDITLDEMAAAKEVFLCSTTKRIVPVLRLNNQVIGDGKPGKATRLLYEKLLQLEHQHIQEWKV